jgi:hypothetical protein
MLGLCPDLNAIAMVIPFRGRKSRAILLPHPAFNKFDADVLECALDTGEMLRVRISEAFL